MTGLVFRTARPEDFDFCSRLYFAGVEETTRAQRLDRRRLVVEFRMSWIVSQVRIAQYNGLRIGWLQSKLNRDSLFLAQLFIDPAERGRGFGTDVMRQLIAEAHRAKRPMTLVVARTNPAQRLYRRLGFFVTHDDPLNYYMKREPHP